MNMRTYQQCSAESLYPGGVGPYRLFALSRKLAPSLLSKWALFSLASRASSDPSTKKLGFHEQASRPTPAENLHISKERQTHKDCIAKKIVNQLPGSINLCSQLRIELLRARLAAIITNNNNSQDDGQDQQQTAHLVPSILLVSAGGTQLAVGTLSVVSGTRDIIANDVELTALVVDHMSDISEQFVELAHGLLDVTNLGLALDNQGLLEVDLRLICQTQLFLLLLLLQLLLRSLDCWRTGLFESCTGSGGRGALLFEGSSLQGLEFGQGSLELLVQLSLGVLLGGLWSCQACTFFKPSPISLKLAEVSSRRSWTLSRTRSVSRLVPSRATWLDSREMFASVPGMVARASAVVVVWSAECGES
ncbi:t-SNARE, partial [Aureobasidium melanogenum]